MKKKKNLSLKEINIIILSCTFFIFAMAMVHICASPQKSSQNKSQNQSLV